MKKAIYGLSAIVIAVAAFAFTNVKKQTQYYWFPLNGTSGAAQTLPSIPTYSATDPANCDNLGNVFCEGAFTSYTTSGNPVVYSASGSNPITNKKQ